VVIGLIIICGGKHYGPGSPLERPYNCGGPSR
jgi:hypothetical protein